MKEIMKWLAVAAVVAATSGCAINRATATVDPTADLEKVKSVHVIKLPKDERGVNKLIADKLTARGLKVTTGTDKREGVDAVVTYVDKWMWDITMYLLDLTIAIRDPKTDFPMATGNSHHTSLTRKTPEEMVDEVIGNIYAKKGAKQ